MLGIADTEDYQAYRDADERARERLKQAMDNAELDEDASEDTIAFADLAEIAVIPESELEQTVINLRRMSDYNLEEPDEDVLHGWVVDYLLRYEVYHDEEDVPSKVDAKVYNTTILKRLLGIYPKYTAEIMSRLR